ncbi:MAG: hypothetical protein HUK20_12375 [Fibrobacter sp.]|nr:hypothetical protein [Fibrobacter sp.]
MSYLKRYLLLLAFCLSTPIWAADIMAQASNGAMVILHDDGRWEYYKNNSQIRDVRPDAIPEDAKYQVNVKYESADQLRTDLRMALDAEFATEEEIVDSLRSIPKGGIVYFQVATSQIKKGIVRKFNYAIYDGGKKPIFTKQVADSSATPSGELGVSNLLVVPLKKKVKGKVLKARVVNPAGYQSLEFEIPVK